MKVRGKQMFTIENGIKKFLFEANQYGYSNEDAQIVNESDGSHTISHENGDWKFHDNFFGGEPYGGREVIFYRNKPVWMMVYYGAIHDRFLKEKIYKFLRASLRKVPDDEPYRGPASYNKGDWLYRNTVIGDIKSFTGKEIILYKGHEVFHTIYQGGLVEQQS
jgi:hypothetical protein